MIETADLPPTLRLEPAGDGRYRVQNEGDPATHNVVFGGQLLAQMIVAATTESPHKTVQTIHTVFARAARIDADTDVVVQPVHEGRAFASHTVDVVQGDRLCARGSVLLHRPDDDVIAHQDSAPSASPPGADATTATEGVFPGAHYVIADGIDLADSSGPTGPAALRVWYRSPGTPDDPTVNQAVLAWATDGFLIGVAMRPHAGVGYDRAHVDLATGVISHTLTFHRPFALDRWLQMEHLAPFAGAGRSYGSCQVFDADGTLVASFVQDAMIRAMPT